MEFTLGVLHWSPDQFWRATFYEISCAYIGHCKANGTGQWAPRGDGWTREDLEQHRREIEDIETRFPPPKPAKKPGKKKGR